MHPDIEKILISQQEIEQRLDELADEINAEMRCDEITVMLLMTGAIVFAADLIRRLNRHVRLEPVAIRSYTGDATRSTGKCEIRLGPSEDITGRDILIIDDIYDSGNTLEAITQTLLPHKPASIHTCMLLDKARPDLKHRPGKVHWRGFEIPDEFVVGYGLDHDGLYRNLPYIGVLKTHAQQKQI